MYFEHIFEDNYIEINDFIISLYYANFMTGTS
jgi:hypothetical protein